MSQNVEVSLLLREGKTVEALKQMPGIPESSFFHTRALEACYTTPRPAGADRLLEQVEKEAMAFHDPEPRFGQAGLFNFCLGNDFTARLAKASINGGFCAYDYLQMDPLLAEFRKSPQYSGLLAEAKQCRDRFLAEREKP